MFFELDGVTYRIKFYRLGRNTIAELFEVVTPTDADSGGIYSLGVFGIARQHPIDPPVKKIGRRVALTNMLKALSHAEEGEAVLHRPLTRDDRQAIWARYFESHRK